MFGNTSVGRSVLFAIGLVGSAYAEQVTFQGLGQLPGASWVYSPTGVTADGVVVGCRQTVEGRWEAFRWTQQAGMESLGDLTGELVHSGATSVSADGSLISGFGYNADGALEAAIWTAQTGMMGLGMLTGDTTSRGQGVSADGRVVVGSSADSQGFGEAFRWTSTGGMIGLGHLGGPRCSAADDVSADGSVIVGISDSDSGWCIFRWTEESGMVALDPLLDFSLAGDGVAVSGDGTAVVSAMWVHRGYEAFRWTQADGVIGLGSLADGVSDSVASDLTADGSVVVGYSLAGSAPDYRIVPFVWTSEEGMRDLNNVLADDYGVDLGGWGIFTARAISPDGTTIVGAGRNPAGEPEAWVVSIPESPAIALLTLGVLLSFRRFRRGAKYRATRYGDARMRRDMSR
jgi:probable HAF family extracellular repeat protein